MRKTCTMVLSMLLAGCIVPEPGIRPNAYDFGQLPAFAPDASVVSLPVLAVADILAPRRLDSTLIYYRLAFSDNQLAKPYADSRWSMPPPQLLTQRLKNRLAGSARVLGTTDARTDLRLLVELEEFDQIFDTPDSSHALVRLRASLIRGQSLLVQQTFAVESPAVTNDSPGGVHALTRATDAALDQLAIWLEGHLH